MSESAETTMIRLLEECLPYLTSAKTGFDLPSHLKGDVAARLQKTISNVVKIYKQKQQDYFDGVITKRLEDSQ